MICVLQLENNQFKSLRKMFDDPGACANNKGDTRPPLLLYYTTYQIISRLRFTNFVSASPLSKPLESNARSIA